MAMRCKYFGQCGGDSCSKCLVGIEETRKQAINMMTMADSVLGVDFTENVVTREQTVHIDNRHRVYRKPAIH